MNGGADHVDGGNRDQAAEEGDRLNREHAERKIDADDGPERRT